MSWLRLDDGTHTHPKVLELTRADRWRWIELLLSCAHAGTEGVITPGMLRACDIGPKLASELIDIALLDRHPDGTIAIHDWHTYNPGDPGRNERQARYRARQDAAREGREPPSWAAIRPPQPRTPSGFTGEKTQLVSSDSLSPDAESTPQATKPETAESNPSHNASRDAFGPLPPVPVPVTSKLKLALAAADEQTNDLQKRRAARSRSPSPGTVADGVAAELARLRALAPESAAEWGPEGGDEAGLEYV